MFRTSVSKLTLLTTFLLAAAKDMAVPKAPSVVSSEDDEEGITFQVKVHSSMESDVGKSHFNTV